METTLNARVQDLIDELSLINLLNKKPQEDQTKLLLSLYNQLERILYPQEKE